jgi:EmrB/QacA subfamily drug resistance transporter
MDQQIMEREAAKTASPGIVRAETVLSPAGLSHREILVTLSGILLGTLLAALDQNIVTTAVPAIADELGGFEHLSWIFAGYLLTSTASTPIYGKLSDLYGRGRLLMFSIALFVISSAGCALAQDMGQLVAARALQGLGGGGLVAIAQSIVGDLISPRERGRYQVYFAGTWAAASVGGPVLGGLFVQYLSWRWVFWINLPVGALALILCWRAIEKLPVPRLATRTIDYAGAVLLTLSVTALLLVSTWGGSLFPWLSLPILGLFAAGLVLLAIFVLQEFRAADPILPPRLFANPIITVSNLVSFIVSIAMFGGIVLMPVHIQLVLGVSPGSTGLLLIPVMSGTVVSSFITGRVMRRTGRYKHLPPIGLAVAVAAFLLLATMNPATPPVLVMAYLGLMGLGLGPTFPVMLISIQNTCESRDLGVATSWVFFSRTLGGSFGAALLWSGLLAALSGRLNAEGHAGLASALIQGGPSGAAHMSAGDRGLILPALSHAFTIVFLIAAAITLLACIVSLFLKEEPLRSQRHHHASPLAEGH